MVRRSSRRHSADRSRGVPQLPWKRITSPYAPVEVLTPEQLESIHETSMRILEEVGVEFLSAEGRRLFAEAGAAVDEDAQLVRLDRGLVAEKLRQAPSRFELVPRDPERAIVLGGNHVNFSLVGGPPTVHDLERGRRSGNYEDYCNLVRLAQYFNIIHCLGNQCCPPIELPAESRHLDCYFANLTLTSKIFHLTAIGRERALDGIRMTAIARELTLDELAASPSCLTIISVNSPRRFDDAMTDGLIAMAEHGQAVVVTPFTLMGAMTPVSLAAALAQQNAEALAGLALAQIVRPGVPVVYGGFTSNVDMRSGAPAFGTPEYAKAAMAGGQLARRYGLPYRSSNANASNCADAQAAYESEMAIWGAVMGHANLVYHGAGWLEGGLTASYEKLVLDVEMLQMMAETLRPIEVNEAELAFETIREVKPGGHFFGTGHTLERYQTAFYQPLVSDWRNYESWEEAGAEDAARRALRIWKQALEETEEPAIDPAIRDALTDFMARRREELKKSAA